MQNGTIIVLAWPEGMVKNADSWYDFFLSKNGMYRVGHSAIILINNELESINYFDFGRYHTPNGFGRVRDEVTDPDLKILTKPKIKNNKLINLHSILLETADKKSTHGKGKMYASVMKKVSFTKSYNCAKKLQKNGPKAISTSLQCINVSNNHLLSDGLDIEVKSFGNLFGSDETNEGLLAFVEKRTPKFKN